MGIVQTRLGYSTSSILVCYLIFLSFFLQSFSVFLFWTFPVLQSFSKHLPLFLHQNSHSLSIRILSPSLLWPSKFEWWILFGDDEKENIKALTSKNKSHERTFNDSNYDVERMFIDRSRDIEYHEIKPSFPFRFLSVSNCVFEKNIAETGGAVTSRNIIWILHYAANFTVFWYDQEPIFVTVIMFLTMTFIVLIVAHSLSKVASHM